MAFTNTVAIIGAATPVGGLIAKSMACDYRLLLMDSVQPGLASLQSEIQAAHKNAEVDILHCCKNASWEADIIVVAKDEEDLEELARKMEDVSNCKTVLHFTSREDSLDRLQQLLPHSKVVTILSSQLSTGSNVNAIIRGTDKEALDTAKKMVAAITCQAQTS